MKIEIRVDGPPRNDASLTSEIEITLPSAGETMSASPAGVFLSRSLKKKMEKMPNASRIDPSHEEKGSRRRPARIPPRMKGRPSRLIGRPSGLLPEDFMREAPG